MGSGVVSLVWLHHKQVDVAEEFLPGTHLHLLVPKIFV